MNARRAVSIHSGRSKRSLGLFPRSLKRLIGSEARLPEPLDSSKVGTRHDASLRNPWSGPQIGAHVQITLGIGDLNALLPEQPPDLVENLTLDVVHAVV